MLARDLLASVPAGIELVPFTRTETDVTDPAAVQRAVDQVRPQIIINAAAWTNVDGAETEWEAARRLNGQAPGFIGRAAQTCGALVVHYSTDYIFNGRAGRLLGEDERLEPLSAYGRSKLEGEQTLAGSGARYLLLRTQWLFGKHGRSFPRTMWERATAKQQTRVVNDQFGRPTYTVDLAAATWVLLDPRLGLQDGGVFHVANTGVTNWFEMARQIFITAGVPELLQPCSTAEFPRPAKRPAWSALDTSRYDRATGEPLPDWQDAVQRFLGELAPVPAS